MLRPRALPAPAPLPAGPTRTRWLWLVPLLAGFLTAFGWVVAHDPGPGLHLSNRSWLTLGLAGLLTLLLGKHRVAGPRQLAAMLAQYAAVALLTLLLTTTPAGHPTAKSAAKPAAHPPAQAQALAVGDGCPGIRRLRAWVTCVLQQANDEAKRLSPTTTTTPRRKT